MIFNYYREDCTTSNAQTWTYDNSGQSTEIKTANGDLCWDGTDGQCILHASFAETLCFLNNVLS